MTKCLLKHKYRSPRKFYKKHLQDLKYNTYTKEDLALLNQFGLVEFENNMLHQLPYTAQVEEHSNTQDGFRTVNLSTNGLLMNTKGQQSWGSAPTSFANG
jgi:hypothetical protein